MRVIVKEKKTKIVLYKTLQLSKTVNVMGGMKCVALTAKREKE